MGHKQTRKRRHVNYIHNTSLPKPTIVALTQYLLNSFNVPDLSDVLSLVRNAIPSLVKNCEKRTEWIHCENTCAKTLRNLITIETESTAYMLRALTDSVISVDGSAIEFEMTGPLSGAWANDSNNIRIKRLGTPVAGRLILGLGPSAAGKTFWTQKIINMVTESDVTFPKTFVTVDGGIYRSSSIIYQYILQATEEMCLAGIHNLVETNMHILHKSLFYAGKIKKQMNAFLEKQTIPLSLYVPETFGDCGFGRIKSCREKYKPYIDITKDSNWLAIFIWQHKQAADCTYDAKFRCSGCTENGKMREKIEGKKYSNAMYEHSVNEGLWLLMRSPGMKYKIHVSGSDDRKSILEDYSTNPIHHTEQFMKTYNYVYIKHDLA